MMMASSEETYSKYLAIDGVSTTKITKQMVRARMTSIFVMMWWYTCDSTSVCQARGKKGWLHVLLLSSREKNGFDKLLFFPFLLSWNIKETSERKWQLHQKASAQQVILREEKKIDTIVHEITLHQPLAKDKSLDHFQAKLNTEDQAANIVHIFCHHHSYGKQSTQNLQMHCKELLLKHHSRKCHSKWDYDGNKMQCM